MKIKQNISGVLQLIQVILLGLAVTVKPDQPILDSDLDSFHFDMVAGYYDNEAMQKAGDTSLVPTQSATSDLDQHLNAHLLYQVAGTFNDNLTPEETQEIYQGLIKSSLSEEVAAIQSKLEELANTSLLDLVTEAEQKADNPTTELITEIVDALLDTTEDPLGDDL